MATLVLRHRSAFIALLFLCWHASASAQLHANFSASPVSGCSPVIVNFTDLSTGTPTQWRWDLGNGVVSTLRNPSATYFNPGTYTVKLTVRNADGADSTVRTSLITVYANPVVRFGASDTTGCFPLSIQFADQSTAGSGAIANWQWDFGDGSLSSAQTPSHVYSAAGNFTVSLKVTNNWGCVKTLSKDQYIRISNGVQAGFTQTDPGPCAAPAVIQFTNTSSGPGSMSYHWDFGDGATSTDPNPSHSYAANGAYTVTLVALSPQGCRDTIRKTNVLNIGASHTGFTAPDTICVQSPVAFVNTTPGAVSSQSWNFSDGGVSSDLNPVHVFGVPGIYTVKLVNHFGSCSDSASRPIVVAARPQAGFTADARAFCQAPATVHFHVQGQGYSSVLWNFGDGASSTQANPVHVYTSEGSYTVSLIVANAAGCTDTLTMANYIEVRKPQVMITGLPRTGCAPITINPVATVTSNQPVQSYLWLFGDGATATGTAPTHTYTNAGTYTVRLVVTTVSGCTDTVVIDNAVRAGIKPHAAFNNMPLDVCAGNSVQFTDLSSGNADQWSWDFHDGIFASTQNPLHNFSDTGWFDVSLLVMNNTCPDTVLIRKAVHVRPPIVAYAFDFDCAAPFTRNFSDRSTGATTWYWEFGDGTTSTVQNPSHVYASPGAYTVRLTAFNGNCSNVNFSTINVVNEKANITASDTVTCRNSRVSFSAPGVHPANIVRWQWNFGDGATSSDPSAVTHSYTTAGTYTVTLTIEDILHCTDTKTIQVHVFGPKASFTVASPAACLGQNNISFSNTSTGDGVHPIVSAAWSYGDAAADTTMAGTVHHHYGQAGIYTVGLTVTDNRGCSDAAVYPAAVTIAQPVAAFASADTASCTDKNISFNNTSSGSGLQYSWSFGDGQQAIDQNPVHHYGQVGQYDVALTVTDQFGCKDSVAKPQYIRISLPRAAFEMSDSFGTCPPLIVHFTNHSTNYAQIQWNFGDGTTSSLTNPAHFYNTPGTYYAEAIVTGPGGCTDTLRKKITVKGPNGSFTYEPLAGCKPLTVTFRASTLNNASFVWDFSDGNTSATQDSVVTHIYATPGDFVPKMILVDAGGCNVPITGIDTIHVASVAAGFRMDADHFCTTGTVHFTNTTVGNDYISGYQWSFGDGVSSTDANPLHTYTDTGSYTVQLIATTQLGCSDTLNLSDTVRILPSPSISIGGDTLSCVPALMKFKGLVSNNAGSALSWQWNFGDGGSSSAQNPLAHSYTAAGQYQVSAIATARNGCSDTATRAVRLNPLPNTNAGADQWICRGSVADLQATGADTYQWNEQPSLSCTTCATPLAAPLDSVLYIVKGTNTFGCSTSDSIVVRVHQPFQLTVDKGDTICNGQLVHLHAYGADQYSWIPAATVDAPNAAATAAHPQVSTTYKVVAMDNNHCFTDTASVFIKVWPIPTVTIGSAQTLVVGQALTLQPVYSSDVSSWLWNNGGSLSCANCPAPSAHPKQTTKYTVKAMNGGGCSAQADVTVSVICNNGNLFIPNTFSPNGDGMNDRFYPSGTGINMIRTLRVFNRWGEVVFERSSFAANDAASGWDGTFKGQPLASDVYVYTCEVICQNNEVLTFKGDVTLLR